MIPLSTHLSTIAVTVSLFTLAACADETETISKSQTSKPPTTETPIGNDPDPGKDSDETPAETPQENPADGEASGITTLARSYETGSGQWKSYRHYEYRPDGRVSNVTWQTHTPYQRNGTYTYVYDGDQLQKIVTDAGAENVFHWENGRIVRSENYKNGVLKDYTLYAYDTRGNVGATESYYRQSSGEFLLGFSSVYLYFEDGNLYKVLTYAPSPSNDAEPVLLTTQTYEGYSAAPNPFPMVTILPTVTTQKNLPSSYHFQGHDKDLQYTLGYEFREDGYPLKRTVSGAGTSEITVYKYY